MKDYKIVPVGRARDIRGQKFGRLTVIDRVEKNSSTNSAYWLCQCDCGNSIIARGSALTTNHTKIGRAHV